MDLRIEHLFGGPAPKESSLIFRGKTGKNKASGRETEEDAEMEGER